MEFFFGLGSRRDDRDTRDRSRSRDRRSHRDSKDEDRHRSVSLSILVYASGRGEDLEVGTAAVPLRGYKAGHTDGWYLFVPS